MVYLLTTGSARLLDEAASLLSNDVASFDELCGQGLPKMLADEIAFRCDGQPSLKGPMGVNVEIEHRREIFHFKLAVQEDRVELANAIDIPIAARLRVGAMSLTRFLFGDDCGDLPIDDLKVYSPAEVAGSSTNCRSISSANLAEDAGRAVRAIISGLNAKPSLISLALRYGSDKEGPLHWYADKYERHLDPYRERRIRLLEIGVGGYGDPCAGGESLFIWHRYFRRALIYGLDVYDKSGLSAPRLVTLQGDQSDVQRIHKLSDRFGPFDIVIDDGSHINSDVTRTFGALYPRLAMGGLYIIEDLQTAYWPDYGGAAEPRSHAANNTSVGLLKSLFDDMNSQEWLTEGAENHAAYSDIRSLHLYHNIAFIEKGRAWEPGAPDWVSRQPAR